MIHLPDFHVVVCKKCQYAVLPSQIDIHFAPQKPHGTTKTSSKPHSLSKGVRERIKAGVAQIDGLIPSPDVLKHYPFSFPPATSRPIPALFPPKTDGIRCTFKVGEGECGYICCSLRQMREHCGVEHQWKSQEKGGRPMKGFGNPTPTVPWQTGIHCQRFFKQGHKS